MAGSSAVLARLQAHLQELQNSATTPLDERLLEEAELVMPTGQIDKTDRLQLARTVADLVKTYQQDPTPLVKLLIRLLERFSYSDVLAFDPPPDFPAGLAVGQHMGWFNRLVLSMLGKAALRPSDAATVATQPATVLALVKLWLCTSDTGVASQASQILIDLLRVDQEVHRNVDDHLPLTGQGLVWKRLFWDKHVYGTIFEICSLSGDPSLDLSKNERTVAQARLMDWLPAVAKMDWAAISMTHRPDVEANSKSSSESLLEFATLRMVDTKDDVLMHRCLIDFYAALITTVTQPEIHATLGSRTSVSLEYLVSKGVHKRSSSYYLSPEDPSHDPLDVCFLYGPSSNYLAAYAESYPDHYLSSATAAQVSTRLSEALDLTPSRWAHADSPKNDLHLLASLPRKALLPRGSSAWTSSPLSALPSRSTNPDVLNTLATIFHGPDHADIVVYPPGSPLEDHNNGRSNDEAVSARALYYLYLNNNPRFWSDIVLHAETIALKEQALTAINCLTAVITANWSAGTEVEVPMATPTTGTLAILTPPALEYTLPYLLKPAQSFANLVGGRGDAESSAYKVATAKYDALTALHRRLIVQVEQEPGSGYEDILATVGRRLAEGPLSREGEVGGRIATLDL